MSDQARAFSAETTAAVTAASPTVPTAAERRRGLKVQFRGPLRCRRAGEREALLLTLLCALDMYTTLYWVVMGIATEANKFLAWTFNYHPLTFVAVKCASCLPALMMAPRLAQRRPQFTIWLLRVIILVYIGIYLIGINHTAALPFLH